VRLFLAAWLGVKSFPLQAATKHAINRTAVERRALRCNPFRRSAGIARSFISEGGRFAEAEPGTVVVEVALNLHLIGIDLT